MLNSVELLGVLQLFFRLQGFGTSSSLRSAAPAAPAFVATAVEHLLLGHPHGFGRTHGPLASRNSTDTRWDTPLGTEEHLLSGNQTLPPKYNGLKENSSRNSIKSM